MVESASLLTRYGFIAHHGFESHTLRPKYRLSVDPKAYVYGLRIEVVSNPLAFTAKGFELWYTQAEKKGDKSEFLCRRDLYLKAGPGRGF